MESQNSICINIQVDVPYMTVEEYSRRSGIKTNTVRDLVQRGVLPTKPRSSKQEKIYINMIALAREAASQQ